MSDELQPITAEARSLRERCIAAHNRLIRDARYSPLGELVRRLSLSDRIEDHTPEHRLLSSYTFWGSRKIGGSRRGFDKRLNWLANPRNLEFYQSLRRSPFGAWRCVDESVDDDGRSRWESVGRKTESTDDVDVVFDGLADEAEAVEGQMRAGWIIEEHGRVALAFSIPIAEEAARRLCETAAEKGWHDDRAAGDEESYQKRHYERDILLQSVWPYREECGLEELYFLPENLREDFPERFRAAMLETMVRELSSGDLPWQLRLACSDPDWVDSEITSRLDEFRKKAARRAGRYRGQDIDTSKLNRLLSDGDCLELLGLTQDGDISLDSFPPIELHPVQCLDVGEQWFEETGIHPGATIRLARQRLEEETPEHIEAFERAVDRHRNRLRWSEIMHHADEVRELSPWWLSSSYGNLLKMARILFDPVITKLPLSRILADHCRSPSRIEKALVKGGCGESPLCVEDLPRGDYSVGAIPGIGSTSKNSITEGLREALLTWPPELERRVAEADDEARQHIEEGLDELDDLFG